MIAIVWVLLYLPRGDDRPPREIAVYTTQAACEDVLDGVIRHGLATEAEATCQRREVKQ